MAFTDDRSIDTYDKDMSTFLRALGSIVGAIGTTVTDGLGRLNQRSLGSLEQNVRRLHIRLRYGHQAGPLLDAVRRRDGQRDRSTVPSAPSGTRSSLVVIRTASATCRRCSR